MSYWLSYRYKNFSQSLRRYQFLPFRFLLFLSIFLDFLPLPATKKLIFYVASKGKKKSKKLTKIAKIEEVKINIFCETEINFQEKYNSYWYEQWLKTKPYTLFRQYIFWNIFLGLRHRFFLHETSILVFARLAIFRSIKIRTSLGKIVRKITR